jgi:hypothetical protein
VSNGSTLIAQSPARESVLKRCSRCKCVEGTRKQSGVVVVFDVNPRNRKRYAKCRSCMKDSDERNAKVSDTNFLGKGKRDWNICQPSSCS